MTYQTIEPGIAPFLWDDTYKQYNVTPVVLNLPIEADSLDSLQEEFEKELTEAVRYWVSSGDCITFTFHLHRIWIPDFYRYSKFLPYSENRKEFPQFQSLEDWFTAKIKERKIYYGLERNG